MTTRVVFCAATFAVPSASLAAGGGHGGDPVQVDLWQAGFTIAVFVILLVILRSFAFKPILEGLRRREQFIHDSLAQAKKDREAAESALKEYEQKLHEAKAEATAIVEEGRRDADEVRRREEAKAKEEAEALLQRARREITVATETAVSELYSLSSKLATDVASRVIRKELTGSDHERLIAEAIDEFRSVNN